MPSASMESWFAPAEDAAEPRHDWRIDQSEVSALIKYHADYIPKRYRKSAACQKRMSKFRIGPLVTAHEVQCVRQ
jgi:hypothetical protein